MKILLKILLGVFVSVITCGLLMAMSYYSDDVLLPAITLSFVFIVSGIFVLRKNITVGIGLIVGGTLNLVYWILFFVLMVPGM